VTSSFTGNDRVCGATESGAAFTLAVFGLLAGYYIAYAIGLVRWRLRILSAKRQREALKSDS
jgi:hypothetical protein